MPTVATERAMAAAIVEPWTPQRVDSDASATAMIVALLCCSNSRVMIGLKLDSDDCAQSIEDSLSPGSQSRSPTKLNPGPLKALAWPPRVNSLMRFRMNSSISAISARLTSGSVDSAYLMEPAPAR
jgi:hypothetical protein